MSDRSLGRTLWNLFLALLNATLILLAVCLWLAWGVTSNLRGLAAEFAQNLIDIAPLRDEVRDLREDVAGLRTDLATITNVEGTVTQVTLSRVLEVTERIDERMNEIDTRIEAALRDPEELIGRAVDLTFAAAAENAAKFRQCTPEAPVGSSG